MINDTFLDTKELVVIILSQKEGYHAAHADILQRSIEEQASVMEVVCIFINYLGFEVWSNGLYLGFLLGSTKNCLNSSIGG